MRRVPHRACVWGGLGTSQILNLRGRAASATPPGPTSTPRWGVEATIVDKHVTTLM